MKHVMLKYMFMKKEADNTKHEFEQIRPYDKVTYIRSAHEKLRNAESATQ